MSEEDALASTLSASIADLVVENDEQQPLFGAMASSPSVVDIHARLQGSHQADEEDEALLRQDEESESSEPIALEASEFSMDSLKLHSRHVFVMSEAGKPIFSLHGDENQLASLMAVMQAMVNFVSSDNEDVLQSIEVGDDHKIVFLTKSPFILVAVAQNTGESVQQLSNLLMYVYNQLLCVLTLSHVSTLFERRKNFDLRRMLTPSDEHRMRTMIDAFDTDNGFTLASVRALPMLQSHRDAIAMALVQSCQMKSSNVTLVFAVLLAANQLVTMVRLRKHFVHPADLHLLLNLVHSSPALKQAQSWIPICLPKFDASGFLHAHVSYVTDSCCLLLLAVERDVFFELEEAKKKFTAALERQKLTTVLESCVSQAAVRVSHTGCGHELRHFVYKAKSAAQYVASEFETPYMNDEEACGRVRKCYRRLNHSLAVERRKLVMMATSKENIFAWETQSFELYATFSPLSTHASAIVALNNLLRWCKKEENNLFILNAPTF